MFGFIPSIVHCQLGIIGESVEYKTDDTSSHTTATIEGDFLVQIDFILFEDFSQILFFFDGEIGWLFCCIVLKHTWEWNID